MVGTVATPDLTGFENLSGLNRRNENKNDMKKIEKTIDN